MRIGPFVFVLISVLMCFSGSGMARAGEWRAESLGWSVRANQVNEMRFWVLRHAEHPQATITIMVDGRTDLPFAQSFDRLKAERASIDNCPALISAIAKGKYGSSDVNKEHGLVEFSAMDDVARPTCILIARKNSEGGLLFGLILDATGRLAFDAGYFSDVVSDTIEDIDAAHKSHEPAKQIATVDRENSSACTGTEIQNNWVLSWSPKTAIVYVRNPEFLDTDKSLGKKLRFGYSIGGKIDPGKGRDDIYYGIHISARENDVGFVPKKRSLSVDGQMVQEWGQGGGQWAPLTGQTIQALMSGKTAVFETEELGRFRFPLKDLELFLKIADVRQQTAVVQQKLGTCEP
ncbi:MAG: hypothetical protein ACWA49_16735 [Ruegeria sp.]